MRDTSVVISDLQIAIHDGGETLFFVDLLRPVFGRSDIEADAVAG